jgi:hypothetical protein
MNRFARTLPGELINDVDPEEFGFDVIREQPLSEQELAGLVEQLYMQTKERNGMVSPPIERYLAAAAARSNAPAAGETSEG